ncbi:carboxypeptidase M32 [Halogeometricum sp. CBA1124]|uniref:carboxypeptidase M32 n=1 Tax=Halogeometricum sp. CBA1124 TaxID=2668071 RepID=UPI00142B4CC4|nr:carboxypeptidase M32 [Halogeometricum sp. CBA1124]MUV56815.1 carboxypeptidase M32 [Halogeometricum sp. CBA1124]
MDTASSYQELYEKAAHIGNLSKVDETLYWDEQVMMPEGGTPARSAQRAAVATAQHRALTDERLGQLLGHLETSDLDGDQSAVVREVARERRDATCVSEDLVNRIQAALSDAQPAWRNARENNDFSTFEPELRRIIELKREYADQFDHDSRFETLFSVGEFSEPYLPFSRVEEILSRLREDLPPLIEEIQDSSVDPPTLFEGSFPADKQRELHRDALTYVGYNWEHGRFDEAPHPFSNGTPYDARVTTRFDESNLLVGLTSTLHEFGHSTYTRGLPKEHLGTPLGEARSMVVHESQSRLWENHVCRSREFWEGFLPTVKEQFPSIDAEVDKVYAAANRVSVGPLRGHADELTYHLHILVRFEVEKALIEDDLDVVEVPAVWNDKMEEYLGVRPDTDAEGCLQDIHWSVGSIASFQNYTLGSMLAAQLFDAARHDIPNLNEHLQDGEFAPLREWLRKEIHQHGQRYKTPELIERATGEPLSAEPFLTYATNKFGAIYDL